MLTCFPLSWEDAWEWDCWVIWWFHVYHFEEPPNAFPKQQYHLTFPPAVCEASISFKDISPFLCQHLLLSVFFIAAILRVWCGISLWFCLAFPSWLMMGSIFLFREMSVQSLYPFFKNGVVFSSLRCKRSLYILSGYKPFARFVICKYFLLFHGLLFHFPGGIVCSSKLFILTLAQIIFFSVVACAFGEISKKSLTHPRSQVFTPVFSSKLAEWTETVWGARWMADSVPSQHCSWEPVVRVYRTPAPQGLQCWVLAPLGGARADENDSVLLLLIVWP